ncbi:MAG: ATP synthase F1 subunit gamma [Candidatus Korobacteraceae bacterium]|jgi:F-type H+-transporting ATPase subunit gamma
MSNILDIRRRIRSVKSTRQITKAMKMVSAAKLRRAQERALAGRPYAQMIANVLKSLVRRADVVDPETGQPRHPLLAEREEKTLLLILVTGDRGLAGAFNSNIIKTAARFLAANAGKNIDIECVGRKGRDFFRRRYPAANPAEARKAPVQITGEHIGMLNQLKFADVQKIAEDVIDRYTREEIDSVYVVFNEFKSVIAQRLVIDEVLPVKEIGERVIRDVTELSAEERERAGEAATSAGVSLKAHDTEEVDRRAAQFATADVDYIYEQKPERLFRDLLPKYVTVQVYRAMLESVAAEHAARMTAMDSASNNADDMIDSLTLSMNRARQASITKEIIEIVSGAAAL